MSVKAKRVEGTVEIRDARIKFRNFAGKEGDYNKEGERNFCVELDPKTAIDLREEGWNVKFPEPRDPDDEVRPYIQIGVSFGYFPPKIVLVTSRNKTRLQERDLAQLDWAEIINAKLVFRPYNWEHGRKTGVKAYAKTLYITVAEDEFEDEYYDIPDREISEEDLFN